MSKTIGPYRLNPRGNYNPAADPLYSLLDLVSDGGGSFVYINDTPSNEPTSSALHWQQIATMGGQDLVDAAVAARDAARAQAILAQGYKDAAVKRPFSDTSEWEVGSYNSADKFNTDPKRIRLRSPFPVYAGQRILARGNGQFVAVSLMDRIAYTGQLNTDYVDYASSTEYDFAASHDIIVTEDTHCLFVVATSNAWETSTAIVPADLVATCEVDLMPAITSDLTNVKRYISAGYRDLWNAPSEWEVGSYNSADKFNTDPKRIRLRSPFPVYAGQRILASGNGQFVGVVLLDRIAYTGQLNTDYVDYASSTDYDWGTSHDIIVTKDTHCLFVVATSNAWETSTAIVPADLVATFKVYAPYASVTELQALSYEVPSYLRTHLETKAETVRSRQSPSSFSFAFIPDLHHSTQLASNKSKFNVINWLEREIDLKLYISPGDLLFSQGTTKQQALDNLSDILRQLEHKNKLLPAVGNHDNNRDANDTQMVSPSELFGRCFKQLEGTAVFDSTNKDGGYYYYDDQSSKIRFIVLNAHDVPYDVYNGGNLKYAPNTTYAIRQKQLDFVSNIALDFSEKSTDWTVVVVSHAPLLREADLTDYSTDVINDTVMLGIFDAFIAGGSYTSTPSSGDFAQTVSVNFSAQGARTIRCFLFGHYHMDQIVVKNGVSHIGALPVHYFTDGEPSTPRVVGSVSEIAIDVITIDTDTNEIYLTRFGAGSDRTANVG